jgi:maltose O-acetyltransferase
VWLGVNVTVLKGVTIGENSIIGANSLVVKSIPANCVAAGNPCRVIRQNTNASD